MWNLKKIFKRLIILSYAIIMLFVVLSGLIGKFVHPRMIPYIIICGIVLLVFLIVDIFNKKVVSHNTFNKSDIIYIFPIILIFFINNGNLSANVINNKGINVGEKTTQDVQNDDYNKAMELAKEMDEAETEKETAEIRNIVINDSNYIETLIDMSDNLDSYVGSEVSINGFIYRDDTMSSNQFVIGRLAITCCAADAQLFGYLCKYDDWNKLKDNEWFNIKAKIETTVMDGMKLPYFNVQEVNMIDKPKDEYIY